MPARRAYTVEELRRRLEQAREAGRIRTARWRARLALRAGSEDEVTVTVTATPGQRGYHRRPAWSVDHACTRRTHPRSGPRASRTDERGCPTAHRSVSGPDPWPPRARPGAPTDAVVDRRAGRSDHGGEAPWARPAARPERLAGRSPAVPRLRVLLDRNPPPLGRLGGRRPGQSRERLPQPPPDAPSRVAEPLASGRGEH